VVDSEDEDDVENTPVATPVRKQSSRTRNSTRSKATIGSNDEDEQDSEDEDATPQPQTQPKKGRGRPSRASLASAASSTPKATKQRGKKTADANGIKLEPTEDDLMMLDTPMQDASTEPKTPFTIQKDEPVTPPESPAPIPSSIRSNMNPPATPLAEITNNLGATHLTTPSQGSKSRLKEDIDTTPRQKQVLMLPEEPKGPKARIVITHLVMMNFKSYAGRQEVGPFHTVGTTSRN